MTLSKQLTVSKTKEKQKPKIIVSNSDETAALLEKIRQLVLHSKYGEVERLVAEYVNDL